MDTISLRLVDEICMEKQIEEDFLSYGWIRELKKNGKIVHIVDNMFDLNTGAACEIARDKYATYAVLKSKNIPIIEHEVIFNSNIYPEYSYDINKNVDEALKKYNEKIVIKANNSSRGKDVFMCSEKEVAVKTINMLFDKGFNGISICPFEELKAEYRVVFLDNNIELIYRKEKPFVIGNGKSSLKELTFGFEEISSDLDLEYIPKENEKVIVLWKHNLSCGAKAKMISKEDKVYKEVSKIALDVAEAMNVKFVTIDISEKEDGSLVVMEVNSCVCLSKFAETVEGGMQIAKSIYSKAIDKMFSL